MSVWQRAWWSFTGRPGPGLSRTIPRRVPPHLAALLLPMATTLTVAPNRHPWQPVVPGWMLDAAGGGTGSLDPVLSVVFTYAL